MRRPTTLYNTILFFVGRLGAESFEREAPGEAGVVASGAAKVGSLFTEVQPGASSPGRRQVAPRQLHGNSRQLPGNFQQLPGSSRAAAGLLPGSCW